MNLTSYKYQNLLPGTTSKTRWKALTFLIVGLILTVVATLYTKREVETQAKQEYAMVCNEIKIKISTQLQAHAQLLLTGSALFAASDKVTRKEWKEFNERTKINENLPGTQGFGFSLIIPKNQLQQHIQNIRKEGFPDYTVKPAGVRDIYTSIIYLEPFSSRNLRSFGYDMFSEPICRKAMELARDADIVSLSGKVILVQETGKDLQAGTLMYAPVYRNGKPINTVEERRTAIKGWVFSPYRMNDLMQGILGRWDLNRHDRIHLQVYDDSISINSLLFDSQRNDTLNHIDLPSRNISFPIASNGKKWILHFTQSEEQFYYYKGKALILLIGGIAISLLLFSLSFSISNTRYNAQKMAEQLTSELKDGHERFSILLNSSAEAINGIDLNGNCTFANTACLQLLGYTSHEQLLGKNMHNLIHYAHIDGSRIDIKDCRINKAFLEGKGTHGDNEVFWRADGTYFQAEYWSYPIIMNGKIKGAVVSFFDITERKRIEEALRNSEEKLHISYLYARSLIEANLDALVTINTDGKITDVNLATENATGLSRDYLIGTDFSDYFTEPHKARIGIRKVFKQGYVINQPLTIRHSSGKFIDSLYSASLYRDEQGKILGVFASARDITIRKHAEEKLKANEILLKELNVSKDRFISILAHDLKSPFNSILGFLDLLTENIREYDINTIEKQINIVNNSAKLFYSLLEDLLLWAVAKSGKLPFEPLKLNLFSVCNEACGNLILNADNKNITLNHFVAKEINIFADINMVKTILRNLVSNAIKFTNDGGQVDIHAEQNETTATITVTDNGIGIEPDKLSKLFDISQIITTEGTANEKGTGLGLLLCKDLVEIHGGKIWVESKIGKGSDFKFTMPIFSETE